MVNNPIKTKVEVIYSRSSGVVPNCYRILVAMTLSSLSDLGATDFLLGDKPRAVFFRDDVISAGRVKAETNGRRPIQPLFSNDTDSLPMIHNRKHIQSD